MLRYALLLSILIHAGVIFYRYSVERELVVSNPQSTSMTVTVSSIVKPTPIKKTTKKVVAPIEKKQTQAPSETQQTYVADANTDYAPAPIYPKLALRRGLQGQVKLRLGINGNGVPVLIDLIESSGHEILDQAAIFALKKWRFLATTKQEDISFWTEKVIEFQLQ